jgi:hypothetical protein
MQPLGRRAGRCPMDLEDRLPDGDEVADAMGQHPDGVVRRRPSHQPSVVDRLDGSEARAEHEAGWFPRHFP